MILNALDDRIIDAGNRACAQLVRAVSSATPEPLRNAAVGFALTRLHGLRKDGYNYLVGLPCFEDARATVSAVVKVYLVSLWNVATSSPTPGEGQAQLEESKGAEAPKPHAAEFDQHRPGSGRDSRGAANSCGRAGGGLAGHGAGPFPEDWVPLLVDSSALVVDCLRMGVFSTDLTALASLFKVDLQRGLRQGYACGTAMVSALLLSDALPALSRLLSAEAQRGPALVLLTPRQLATCLEPLNELIAAADKLRDLVLPVSPQGLRQPSPAAPSSQITTSTSTTPTPSRLPPTPPSAPGTSAPPAAGPSAATPAAASSGQAQTSSSTPYHAAGEPGGSAAVPLAQGREPTASTVSQAPSTPHGPQTLGPAVLRAVAESGVVEAACRAAVGALEQGAGGRQQQQGAACATGGDREELVTQLLELPRRLVMTLRLATASSLPKEPLQTILAGSCLQYALAAHSVSQLHAVDGGTTYGLPYDSLLPPVREEGGPVSCKGALDAISCWVHTCASGSLQLSPRGLFDLCLRKAEVAADCWRRRNGLPTAAAAASGGSAGDSGSSGSSCSGKAASGGRQHGQGKAARFAAEVDTGRHVGPGGAAGSSGNPAADRPRAMLDPSQCPSLAMQAMACSRALMEGSCGAGAGAGEAGARVSKGAGSGAGFSCEIDRMASSSGKFGLRGGDREAGGGSHDRQGACGGGNGDGMQGGSSPGEEAGGSASVGVRNGGTGGQAGGADTGAASGGCSTAAEEACGSGSGRGGKGSGTWLGDGGPLAWRWWRAAVAAVHCALDEMDAVGPRPAAGSLDKVLDLSLATPESDPVPILPPAPPASLPAALDAGCLSCLERTLRTCFRACNTPAEAMGVCRGCLLRHDTGVDWPLLLAFGAEREAAAFLATAAKVARRACQERARPGGDRKACIAVMYWLCSLSCSMIAAANNTAERIAIERGFRRGEAPPDAASVSDHEHGKEAEAGGDGGRRGGGEGGGGGGGGDGSGGGASSSMGSGGGGGDYSAYRSGGGNGGGSAGRRSSSSSDSSDYGGITQGGGALSSDGYCRGRGGRGGEGGVENAGCAGSSDSSAADSGVSGGGGADSVDFGVPPASAAAPSSAVPTTATAAYCANGTAVAAAAAGSLSPPEQQFMRLLSFALPLWLPLWLDLASELVTDGRLIMAWRGQVRWAFDMLDSVLTLCADALEKKDLRAAESWRSVIVKSREEVEGMLDGCRRVLEREEAIAASARGDQPQAECGLAAEQVYETMEEVEGSLYVLDLDLPQAVTSQEEVEGGWEESWPLVGLGLLPPPCEARHVLACCSNPRCAELAGDSEAGVVLRRCGGACGGAAAYCCAACQRAHWAAGHREECTGKRRGGEKAGVAGSG